MFRQRVELPEVLMRFPLQIPSSKEILVYNRVYSPYIIIVAWPKPIIEDDKLIRGVMIKSGGAI